MEMARSLLKGKRLPGEFWGESVRHAVHLINRLPTKSLAKMTPYEAWYGVKPNLESLRVFGCIAYVKTVGKHLRKLDDKSKKMVHLGIEDGTKGYRLFDPIEWKLKVARDVIFQENEGWVWIEKKVAKDVSTSYTIQVAGLDVRNAEYLNSTDPQGPSLADNASSSHTEPSLHHETDFQQSSDEFDQGNSTNQGMSSSSPSSESSSEVGPQGYQSLQSVYNDTQVIYLDPEELMMIEIDEPLTYKEAASNKEWQEAMKLEMNSIERNRTWKLVDLP